ncbi:unnamed protein product [Camellia sinensis]
MRNGPGTFCVLKFVELDVQLKLAEAYWEFLYLQSPVYMMRKIGRVHCATLEFFLAFNLLTF